MRANSSASIDYYLVRHGEAESPWSSGADSGLSDTGREQAARLIAHFATIPLADVVTSPLQRAIETASVLCHHWRVEPRIEPCFAEVPVAADTDVRKQWLRAVDALQWRDVETSIQQWRDSAWRALLALPRNTVIFTHFMVINALLTRGLADPRLVYFEPAYASVTQLRCRNGTCELVALGARLQ